jgi:putative hydroxymethylpyrimidine transporter CytX
MPAKGGAVQLEGTPAWGIEPVPERLRVLGLLDTALLWGNLGVSLLVLVAGTYLVPALSLREAFLAILLGSLIGNTMLGLAALIGAGAHVPAMVLLRAPLGQRGSWAPTVLNAAQCIGWSIFELLIIATAVAALSDELLGFRAQWLWTLVFGAVALVLALLGPVDFVRKFVRKVAVWAVLASVIYLTWWALDGSTGGVWDSGGEGGSSVLEGVDLVVAITVSWIPLVADYSRFSTSRRAAFWGTGAGYFVASAWLWTLGAILFFTRDVTDPAALPVAVAAGGIGAVLALLAVTVDETDEAFANVYSTAVSVQNLAPKLPQRTLLVAVAAIATLGALTIDLLSYESFLLMLGSFFVPLFGVLLADWLVAGRRYDSRDVFEGPAVRWGMLAAWIAGFALYQWLHPVGPSWWTDAIGDPPDYGIGATLPSFFAALALGLVLASLGRRRI